VKQNLFLKRQTYILYNLTKARMDTSNCLRGELAPAYCECCTIEGKYVRKFVWRLASTPQNRVGYFCSEGHFWEVVLGANVHFGGSSTGIDYGDDKQSRIRQRRSRT
jgi:hypothetical protein